MAKESKTLLHASNVHHNKWAPALAKLLVTQTQTHGGLGWAASGPSSTNDNKTGAKVFFANSGTEANEGALKIARKVGKDRWAARTGRPADDPLCTKFKILCFENSFHGRSMGALSVTTNPKYQKPFAPLIPGIQVGKLNDYGTLEEKLDQDVCAVIVEPIQGEGGIHVAETEWLRALRAKCDQVGAVLIYDEIQASHSEEHGHLTI